jgi:hypothetical protein
MAASALRSLPLWSASTFRCISVSRRTLWSSGVADGLQVSETARDIPYEPFIGHVSSAMSERCEVMGHDA